MADFSQNGIIGTLHDLRNRSIEDLESELVEFSAETPMSLLLPCLYSELEGPAMGPIVNDSMSQLVLRPFQTSTPC